jgi:hypothetical protein
LSRSADSWIAAGDGATLRGVTNETETETGKGDEARPVVEKPSRWIRWLLALVVLFLGGSGLVYEYCLSTVATHLLGNSIEQFSVIIALMLSAMGVAGMVQGGIKRPEHLAAIFVAVEIGLGTLGGASAVLLYLAFAYLEHFRFVLYLLAVAIGFGIGMEIPLLMRINQRCSPSSGATWGRSSPWITWAPWGARSSGRFCCCRCLPWTKSASSWAW